MRHVALLLLACLSGICRAAVPPDLERFVKERFPAATISAQAHGILDETGAVYYAALINGKGHDFSNRILVFKEAGGHVTLVDMSDDLLITGRSMGTVQIKDKLLLLVIYGSGGCCSFGGSVYKFRRSGDGFLLIGEESIDASVESTDDNPEYYESKASVNFITGTVIHSRLVGTGMSPHNPKPSWMIYRVTGPISAKEVRLQFRSNRNWHLREFDTFQYSEWQQQINNLCGHIGKDMVFHQCNAP